MFQPSAIIFDCDGTLVDSMPTHYIAWARTVSAYGLTFDEDRFYALGGWPTLKVAELLIEENHLDVSAEEMSDFKEALFEEHLDEVTIIEPVVAVVEEHYGKIPLGVATGAIERICVELLTHAGILDRFETLVAADHVQKHKPAPETYLLAARNLAVAPEECLVYEDTDPGVEAGFAAGMQVVDVRDFYQPKRVTS